MERFLFKIPRQEKTDDITRLPCVVCQSLTSAETCYTLGKKPVC